MKSVLMVMNARNIPEAMLAIRALPIDKAWFRGYSEKQLEGRMKEFIEGSDYDRYILLSDDTIPTEQALRNLLKLQDRGPVVTGWCNIFPGNTVSSVELERLEEDESLYLRVRNHLPSFTVPIIKSLYRSPRLMKLLDKPINDHFAQIDQVFAEPEVFRTFYVNFALTSMSRETWMRFGFEAAKNGAHGSDRILSAKLKAAGVPMLCARDSFVYHLMSVRNFIVGKAQPQVILEKKIQAVLP